MAKKEDLGKKEIDTEEYEIINLSDLYEKEIERYRNTLRRDIDKAYERYGFTVFHSLPPIEKIRLKEKIGFQIIDEIDYYNLGVAAVTKEEYQKGRENFEKAIELKSDFSDALYNLALSCEKLNDYQSAVKYWNAYLDLIEDTDEKQEIKKHLQEIKKL